MSPSTVDSTDGQRHASGRGDVADAAGDAARPAVEQELDRERSAVLADQHGRMVRAVSELRSCARVPHLPRRTK